MHGIEGLSSSKQSDILSALENARESGTIEWVRPLLEAFRDQKDEEIRHEIGSMLGSLKISEAAEVLADALEDPEFESIQADVVCFLWSCGFQSENELRSVIRCAVEGDFRCAMEALTWLEELEVILDENALLDAILMVRGVLEAGESGTSEPLHQAILTTLLGHERNQ